MRKGLTSRLGWMEASLRYAGVFGVNEKKAYMTCFSISDAVVSRDQDAFLRHLAGIDAWGQVVKSRGRLVLDGELPVEPIFELPSMRAWLAEALVSRFEEVETVRRAEPPAIILQPIVTAILEKRRLTFYYHSRKGRRRCSVSPQTMVSAAGRLHLRAWDHDRGAARDFVMTRILWVELGGKAGFIDRTEDVEWSQWVDIEIQPKADEDLEALRLDYDLDPELGYRKRHRVRRAHLIYMLDKGESLLAPVIVQQTR